MKILALLSLLILSSTLVSCGQYTEEVNNLYQRISDLEQSIAESNSSAITMLETGKCTLTNIQEDSALMVCGDGTQFLIKNGQDGTNGEDGTSCTVVQNETGSQISCSDGTAAIITNGVNGTNGEDGSSCTSVALATGTQVSCSDGSAAFIANGVNGASCSVIETDSGARVECQDGTIANILNGTDGADGEDGLSCVVSQIEGVGALVECGEDEQQTSAVIYNGQNGSDGVSQVIEYIDPCGDNGRFDEVLLRMADGTIIAHYAGGGNKQFLSIIGPGNYRTTEGYNCNFKVTQDGEVISN